MPEPAQRHERDYLERTIETVRIHRTSGNSWPQWANIFADEIERLWGIEEQLEAAQRQLKIEGAAADANGRDARRLEEQLEAAHDEAAAYHKQSSEQADESRKWRFRAERAEEQLEAALAFIKRQDMNYRFGEFVREAWRTQSNSYPAKKPT